MAWALPGLSISQNQCGAFCTTWLHTLAICGSSRGTLQVKEVARIAPKGDDLGHGLVRVLAKITPGFEMGYQVAIPGDIEVVEGDS